MHGERAAQGIADEDGGLAEQRVERDGHRIEERGARDCAARYPAETVPGNSGATTRVTWGSSRIVIGPQPVGPEGRVDEPRHEPALVQHTAPNALDERKENHDPYSSRVTTSRVVPSADMHAPSRGAGLT